MYKCTTAISTAEEFDSSKWTVASISYEFKKITNELSNKLNSNKVIQESGTASTSNVYSSKAVKNLMKVSFCKMLTNFDDKVISGSTLITGFNNAQNYGDYVADTTNSRLIIKNTSLVQLCASASGLGSAGVSYVIYDSNGNEIDTTPSKNMLIQPAGNAYWQIPLPTVTIELDPTKTYYIYLKTGPYNVTDFHLNGGFGAGGTWISATKIA